jgi:glycosyltransferase involved in cell wall biosynthesis
MSKKEKLLIVSAISPFPKTSGGAVRIYNTIKYLSEKFELYFIFFIPQDSSLNSDELSFLKEKTRFFTYFYQKPKKDYFSFINEFQPYWFSDWNDDEIKIFLPKFIRENQISKVQIEFTQLLYLSSYIPSTVKKIFVAHDISTVSFWRRLFELRNPFTFFVHFVRWIEIYLYEKYYLPMYDLIVTMSENDKKILAKNFKIKNILVKPNGIDGINFLEKKADKVINLGYIGSFNHPPNRTAITYFINKIAPLLEKNKINFRYFIAGADNPADIKKIVNHSFLKNKRKIINLGKVEKVEEFYKKIDIMIAPIFSGSGTRIKILEALSFGVPVITSAIGAEGININNKYLSIANGKNEFINEIIKFTKKNSKLNEAEQIKLKNLIKPLLWKNIFANYNFY